MARRRRPYVRNRYTGLRHRARPAHPVVWVYEDRVTGRWRSAPPLHYRRWRKARRDLGEALVLVVVSAVVLYVVLSSAQ